MKINEETGKFEVDDFALEGQLLRKITKREIKRLPEKLYVLNMNGEYEIEHISYVSEKSLLMNLRYYHEHYGEIFSTFGDYCDNFAAYILFEAIIEDPNPVDITFEGIVSYIKNSDDFVGTAKIGELTTLDMKNMGDIYFPRIYEKNLRKAYDLAQAHVKIMR